MATLTEIVRQRKAQLGALQVQSRKLDAVQEKLEREVKRLKNRKKQVPEVADAQRLIVMAANVSKETSAMITQLNQLARSWAAL